MNIVSSIPSQGRRSLGAIAFVAIALGLILTLFFFTGLSLVLMVFRAGAEVWPLFIEKLDQTVASYANSQIEIAVLVLALFLAFLIVRRLLFKR